MLYLEYTQKTPREQMAIERAYATRFADVEVYAAKKLRTMCEVAMDMAVGCVVEAIIARGFLPQKYRVRSTK